MRPEVQVQHAFPILVGRILERLAAIAPHVAHQNVQLAKALDGPVHHVLRRILPGKVCLQGQYRRALPFQFRRRFRKAFFAPGAQDQAAAFRRKAFGDIFPYAPARSRNDGHLVLQFEVHFFGVARFSEGFLRDSCIKPLASNVFRIKTYA